MSWESMLAPEESLPDGGSVKQVEQDAVGLRENRLVF